MNTQTETKKQYLTYIKDQLTKINPGEAKASYDTGYGITLVDENMGAECHAFDIMAHRLISIRPPNISGDEWHTAWKSARTLINKYIKNNVQVLKK